MPTITLTYFNSPGRAEPVRVALTLAGVPFEDRRVDFPGFMALKQAGALPLGSLPILEVDGVVMTQTAAMLRWAARQGGEGLYPADPMAAFVVDSVIDTFNDTLASALMPSLFEQDRDKRLAMRKAFVEGPLARALRYVESLAARAAGPFLTGPTLTIADLMVGNQLAAFRSGVLDGIDASVLADFPRLAALADAYLAHPGVAAYRAR